MDLYEYDRQLDIPGFCGIDEAGRGPLAGDVYAAAVVLDPARPILGLNDSKKLTEKKREALFDEILEKAEMAAVGIATVEEIEQLNILQATFLAMRRAVENLPHLPSLALVDGNRNPPLPVPSRFLIKGDATSASIAAASILAKVSRDRRMVELAGEYPQYQFEKHKGYPTKEHYAALDAYGPCRIHRMSFLKKYYAGKHRPITDGARGEAAASQYLVSRGYEILEANYRSAYGELDLVVRQENLLVFVEVKTRSTGAIATPKEAVTAVKQQRLILTAQQYLLEHPSGLQPRFDVVEVLLDHRDGTVISIEQIENAFEA
jgi:ribonuclease HII